MPVINPNTSLIFGLSPEGCVPDPLRDLAPSLYTFTKRCTKFTTRVSVGSYRQAGDSCVLVLPFGSGVLGALSATVRCASLPCASFSFCASQVIRARPISGHTLPLLLPSAAVETTLLRNS